MSRSAIAFAFSLALLVPLPVLSAFKLEEPPEEQRQQQPPQSPQQKQQPPQHRQQPRRSERPPPERPPPERAPPERAPVEPPPAPAADEPRRSGSATLTEAEGWAVDPRSRCRVWVGETRPGETVTYSGRCSGGVANGEGELQRRSGEQVLVMYLGTFTNGRLTGPGVRIAAGGDRLEAPFVEGRANGQGVLRYRGHAADRYEGMFRDDKPNGQGVRFWPDGARYEGEWVNGTRTGMGQQLFSDGGRYVGAWRADQPHGRGAMHYANGDMYDGEWVNGRRSGRGTLRWFAPGRAGVYEGQWRDDKRNGIGREVFAPENAVYEGSYINDRPQGRGVYVIGGVERREGEVSDGCMRAGGRVIPIGQAAGACR